MCNCQKKSCGSCNPDPCTPTVQLTTCQGCDYTLNTDCTIYNQDRLSFEPSTVVPNSGRTLTELLQDLSDNNCCNKESKIVTSSYTLLPTDSNKILLLKDEPEVDIATNVTPTLTLPVTADFVNKEFIIKDISKHQNGAYSVIWQIDHAIKYSWQPVLTTTAYNTLANSQKTVRLTLVKTSSLTYEWITI